METFLSKVELSRLFSVLSSVGYRVLAPTYQQGVVQFAETDSLESIRGMQSNQSPGSYRLEKTDGNHYFSWAVGPELIKPLTFSSSEVLWRSSMSEGLTFEPNHLSIQPIAIIGARSCDLAAFALQKKHFQDENVQDEWFSKRADSLFLVAVDCSVSAETCFCHSTGDGPEVTEGYDLRLHELADGFLIAAGTDKGREVLDALPLKSSSQEQLHLQRQQTEAAIKQQVRTIPAGDLTTALREQWNVKAWNKIAERCLSCGNCTAVCPTCFCHKQQDQLTHDMQGREHVRLWDSCFSEQHSYIHGIVIRKDTSGRYRQWLSHKLGFWHEQYGRSGCVGCGRCIAWCPVGIDITESIQQVLEGDRNE